jgi:hypothetical protein
MAPQAGFFEVSPGWVTALVNTRRQRRRPKPDCPSQEEEGKCERESRVSFVHLNASSPKTNLPVGSRIWTEYPEWPRTPLRLDCFCALLIAEETEEGARTPPLPLLPWCPRSSLFIMFLLALFSSHRPYLVTHSARCVSRHWRAHTLVPHFVHRTRPQ